MKFQDFFNSVGGSNQKTLDQFMRPGTMGLFNPDPNQIPVYPPFSFKELGNPLQKMQPVPTPGSFLKNYETGPLGAAPLFNYPQPNNFMMFS